MKAEYNYFVMDATIKEWKKQFPDIDIIYSTPQKYVDALKKENLVWPVRRDDSLPYSQA